MKQKFSTAWKSSKQPRKQRKYLAKAPIHLKRKMMSVNLSKELRKKHERRNVVLRKGDKVKIMRGKFRGKQGKVIEVKIKLNKVYVEGIQTKKRDGSKANVRLQASNLQIVELNLDDKKRLKKETIKGKKSKIFTSSASTQSVERKETAKKVKAGEKKE